MAVIPTAAARLPLRHRAWGLAAVVGALLLTACTGTAPAGQQPTPSTTTAIPPPTDTPAAPPSATFTFGTPSDPTGLDPALVADTESYRVTRQIMQGLVGVDPVTSEPAPLLAESWDERDEGRAYAFKLRDDVVFHDGEPFTAESVCANFDRWYSMPPETRQLESTIAFKSVFKAFSDNPESSLYKSCRPLSESRVLIQLTGKLTGFIPALALPAFAMSSPKALAELTADQLSEPVDGRNLSRYALSPVGTGPFRFDSWEDGEVRLKSFEDYWGVRGEIETVVFTTIADDDARLRALTSGRLDGYDFVTVENAAELAREGQQILQRDPYSILYLGMNQDFPGVDNLQFRQAVAHAIDKSALVEGLFLNGTSPADQFIPPKLAVTNDALTAYEYDVAKARELLDESGYDGEELPFYYPRNVSRPYLPSPEKVYRELSRQLRAAGFNLRPVPIDWSDGYLEAVQNDEERAFHLLGFSGSYQDPDNFVGALFGGTSNEFAIEDNQLLSKIDRARTLPSGPERISAYRDITAQLHRRLPAVPLAFPVSALAVSPRVEGYPVSPVLNEVFNLIDLVDPPDRTDPQ